MGDLTKNFSRKEFACKCGCGFADINPDIVTIAQAIRDKVEEPVIVSSGCRCKTHNKRVGGVHNSPHLTGMAADFRCKSGAVKIFSAIKAMTDAGELPKWGYCKRYIKQNFVHIDVNIKNRTFVYAEGN